MSFGDPEVVDASGGGGGGGGSAFKTAKFAILFPYAGGLASFTVNVIKDGVSTAKQFFYLGDGSADPDAGSFSTAAELAEAINADATMSALVTASIETAHFGTIQNASGGDPYNFDLSFIKLVGVAGAAFVGGAPGLAGTEETSFIAMDA